MIYLDPRTGSGDLLPLISPTPDLIYLPSGDVMAPGHGPDGPILWGAEIKKLGDALQCMQDGRLRTQLVGMQEDYGQWVFFILEARTRANPITGNLQQWLRKKDPKTGKWKEFWADAVFGNSERILFTTFFEWLLSVQMQTGARVLQTGDRNETALMVKTLYRWFSKEWSAHKSMKQWDTSQMPQLVKPSVPAKVAHALAEGIGWEKAIAAASYFGSVRAMVDATEAQWREIPGIDKVLAHRVVSSIETMHVKQSTPGQVKQQKAAQKAAVAKLVPKGGKKHVGAQKSG